MRYLVEIVEKTARHAIIEAASPSEAEAIAERLWSETDASYDNFAEGEIGHDINTEATEEVPDTDDSVPVYTAADLAELLPPSEACDCTRANGDKAAHAGACPTA